METYGSAEIRRHDDGRIEVLRADPVIGISLELLAQADAEGFWVDGAGCIWLAGDHRYRYRPVRFDPLISDIPPGAAVQGCRVLVCEKVEG